MWRWSSSCVRAVRRVSVVASTASLLSLFANAAIAVFDRSSSSSQLFYLTQQAPTLSTGSSRQQLSHTHARMLTYSRLLHCSVCLHSVRGRECCYSCPVAALEYSVGQPFVSSVHQHVSPALDSWPTLRAVVCTTPFQLYSAGS